MVVVVRSWCRGTGGQDGTEAVEVGIVEDEESKRLDDVRFEFSESYWAYMRSWGGLPT